jgi:ribosome-binding factor A
MESTRQRKYARLVQKELGEIIQRDQKGLFHHNMISVTEVSMSPDLSVAKVFLSIVLEKDKEAIFQAIEDNKKEIRLMLSKRIGKQVRRIPELIFYLDRGAEHADEMQKIFNKLNIPPAEDDSDTQP